MVVLQEQIQVAVAVRDHTLVVVKQVVPAVMVVLELLLYVIWDHNKQREEL